MNMTPKQKKLTNVLVIKFGDIDFSSLVAGSQKN